MWGGTSDDYETYVMRKVTSSIRRALRTREPTKIFSATTVAPVDNRRSYNVVDDSVNVLDIVSRDNKERIATPVSMSAHPTIVPPENTVYSAGYVHYL